MLLQAAQVHPSLGLQLLIQLLKPLQVLPHTQKALVGVKTVSDPAYVLGVDSYGSESQTLTVDQIPAHTHTTTIEVVQNRSSSGIQPEGSSASVTGTPEFESAPTGGGQSFDNRMPYIAIAIWKRTD